MISKCKCPEQSDKSTNRSALQRLWNLLSTAQLKQKVGICKLSKCVKLRKCMKISYSYKMEKLSILI